MKTVYIGGVPEHFNYAWYLTLKDESYKKAGINLRWKDFPGGTGAMCKALRNKEIDIAVVLTEGIIKDISAGNPSRIIQEFVSSPLIWGIHVAHHSRFKSLDELKGRKAAISRFGSGSHLMSFIHAQNQDWDLDKDIRFEVVKNLEGAIEALSNDVADYFMWEKFTTKPLVDNKTFKRIGECPTPWPCFVLASHNDFIEQDQTYLKKILEIINNTTREFKIIPSIDRTIANRYKQEIQDVQEWLTLTEWSQKVIDENLINEVQDRLLSANIIPKKLEYTELVHVLSD